MSLRPGLLILFLTATALSGCAPAYPTGPGPDPSIGALQREQADLLRRLDQVQERLLLIEARMQTQQELIARLQEVPVAEKVTQSREITAALPPAPLQPPAIPPGAEKPGTGLSPTEIYLQAFSDFASGRFERAIGGFETFLANFPQNDYAGNAQYWLGECFYSLGRYEQAVAEFRKMANDYPQGSKAPEALWKMASAQMKLNQPAQAEETLRLLRGRYPGSPAARKSLQGEQN